jgi:hypothetical protein
MAFHRIVMTRMSQCMTKDSNLTVILRILVITNECEKSPEACDALKGVPRSGDLSLWSR